MQQIDDPADDGHGGPFHPVGIARLLASVTARNASGGTGPHPEPARPSHRLSATREHPLRGGGDPEVDAGLTNPTDPRGLADLIARGAPPRISGTAVDPDGTITFYD